MREVAAALIRKMKKPRAFGLDAALGSSEERAKSRNTTLRERLSVTDAAMRQEGWRNFGFAESRSDRPRASGYTIIEVMIVLAVSGVVFIAGIAALHGQGGETAFDQGMQDANSELSNQIRSVGSNQFFNSNGYNCQSLPDGVSGKVLATLATGDSSKNQDCVALGTAIEAVSRGSTIYSVQILGNRLKYISNVPSGPATSLAESNPTPARLVPSGPTPSDVPDLLFRTYKLPDDINLVSAYAVLSNTGVNIAELETYLVGFYLDFNGVSNSANGSQTVTAQAYPFPINSVHDAAKVKNCIETIPPPCSQPPQAISLWKLCFQSADGNRKAEIDIHNQPTGLTTELKFENCG
jgi:prepilin-type N-terminal cleavage/methylation domain-containing protein